eukprot:4061961-Pleurochrysis_carterae.AAC.1
MPVGRKAPRSKQIMQPSGRDWTFNPANQCTQDAERAANILRVAFSGIERRDVEVETVVAQACGGTRAPQGPTAASASGQRRAAAAAAPERSSVEKAHGECSAHHAPALAKLGTLRKECWPMPLVDACTPPPLIKERNTPTAADSQNDDAQIGAYE